MIETTFIGLDLGTLFGWAVRYPDGTYESGTWNLSPKKNEDKSVSPFKLYQHLNQLFTRLKEKGKPVVGYELVQGHKSTYASQTYGIWLGITRLALEIHGFNSIPIHTSRVKMTALGKGGGPGTDKNAMIQAAKAKWFPYVFQDDNEVDARYVAEAALHEYLNPTPPKPKAKRK